ncbi:MAG: type IV fimbrial biogenesis protein FimT [Candidatus Azotimanducaceae bacterium]|jgi:type IV fimbrial biogenesis protein FimT
MKQYGVTLPEILALVAVFSIVMGLAIPSLEGMIQRSRATSSINWLVRGIHFARQSAILKNSFITLCPNSDGSAQCTSGWQNGLLVFTDANQNASVDGKDLILARFLPEQPSGSIKWRSFRNRQYLQFTPFGYTNSQNGNFTYCPSDNDLRNARQVLLNAQGRLRAIVNINPQGERLDRKGKLLRCN